MIVNGIDIIEINRIKSVLEKFPDKFLTRIYTKNELDFCKNKPHRLAARFAVKEAVMKTLGTGIKGVGWKDIETIRKPGEKPSVKLHNRALEKSQKLGIKNISISISHSKEFAIAFAIAEKTSI
ncbi:MAG: holo-[acyl-carrier-protein] synthase [SAR202 cluster bacterium]|nr:holo-[acyl-carrier-protein] synthase [SAR202 cluster bacterium]